MKPLVIKSTAKAIIGWLLFSTILLVGIAYYLYTRDWKPESLLSLFAIPVAIDIWAALQLLMLQGRRLTKIEDVRVDQSLSQRLLGIGNLSVQATGDASPLRMENIDNAHAVADQILTAAKAARRA
jgi:Bacterial PH domain